MEPEWSRVLELCDALDGRVPAGADWMQLTALANRMLVTPAMAVQLESQPGIPSDLRDFLTIIRSRTELRNSMMREQLIEAIDVLGKNGIIPLLFKGAGVLAASKGTLADRLFYDLDILIDAGDGPDAVNALKAIGYEEQTPSISAVLGATLQRPQDAGGLDIHLRIRSLGNSQTYAELCPHTVAGFLDEKPVRLPSPTLQAAFLIAHDQIQERDYWRGLIDLRHCLDLREIVRTSGELNVDLLHHLFPRGTFRRALQTQLLTLRALFGIAVPPGFRPGSIATLQFRRRRWQVRRPRSMIPLTMLSLGLDPPFSALAKGYAGLPIRKKAQYLRRMFLPKKDSKV